LRSGRYLDCVVDVKVDWVNDVARLIELNPPVDSADTALFSDEEIQQLVLASPPLEHVDMRFKEAATKDVLYATERGADVIFE